MLETIRIPLRTLCPEKFDLTFIPPSQEESIFDGEFSVDGPLFEPTFLDKTLCPLQMSNSIPVETQSNIIDNLCCFVKSNFGTAHGINPKQYQRILKIRQKRLQCGWTRLDRTKSKARRQHAMRRKRLANGQFAINNQYNNN